MTTKNENTGIEVSDTIGSMYDAIVSGDQESGEQAFHLAMSEKLTSRLDSMKVDIASSLYSN